jgi:hypothetical protein
MANTKVSALTAATVAAVANEIPINEAGTSKKISITQLITLLQTLGMPVPKSLTGDYTNSTTTGSIVTGLNFTGLVAGTYYAKWILFVASAATGTSFSFGVNYTGTVTRMMNHARFPSAGVTAATGTMIDVANATTGQVWAYAASTTESTTTPNLGPWVGVTNANLFHLIEVTSLVVVSDSGDLELYAASETGAVQITAKAGSSGYLIRTA